MGSSEQVWTLSGTRCRKESFPALVSTGGSGSQHQGASDAHRCSVDESGIARLLRLQDGVISRQQVLEHGGDDLLIERRLRRREWAPALTGVYVAHTGPPSWRQHAWAGVLYAAPAALSGASALRAHGVRGHDEDPSVEVAIAPTRRVRSAPGLHVRRLRDYDRIVQTHLSPPRLRVEAALLRVAANARTEDRAVSVLADACQYGVTTPRRLGRELELMSGLPRRALLAEILADVRAGALSPLERRYLRDVERAHRLPRAGRQRPELVDGSRVQRDVEYPAQATVVELDGRLNHEAAEDRWDDLDRDLSSAAAGKLTLRIGWRQVLQPCRTAATIGRILAARGWRGKPHPCGPHCLVA